MSKQKYRHSNIVTIVKWWRSNTKSHRHSQPQCIAQVQYQPSRTSTFVHHPTWPKYFFFIRRKIRCSRLTLSLLRLPTHMSPQTENTRFTYAWEAGAARSRDRGQQWETISVDIYLASNPGQCQKTLYSWRFQQCIVPVQYLALTV